MGCVLNTIDDALDRTDPGGTDWTAETVKHLGPLLRATVTSTIPLTIISFVLGLVLALGVARMRLSSVRVVSTRPEVHWPEASRRGVMARCPLPSCATFCVLPEMVPRTR